MVNSNDSSVFILAEIANTHNGSIKRAEKLIRQVALTGADAIKFQVFKAEDLVSPMHPEYPILKNLELQDTEWKFLFSLAHDLNLEIFSDIFHVDTLGFLEDAGCQGYKIHSSDIHNSFLLKEVGRTMRPVLLSLGGVCPRDTWKAANDLAQSGCSDITLMLGFQAFPTKVEDNHLRLLGWYRENFGLSVGYADHTDSENPMANILPLLAIAAGAETLEKHFTHNRSGKPEDYESSFELDEFRTLVKKIREAELILGRAGIPEPSKAEKIYSKKMKKFPLVVKNIKSGNALSVDNVKYQRISTETEVYPANLNLLLGKKALKEVYGNSIILNEYFQLKVGALVAVRSNSSRLPLKALIQLNGKTVISHLIDRIKSSSLIDTVILCTTTLAEDDILVSIAEQKNIDIFRGDDNDVMGRFINAAKKFNIDIVVRVTGDDIFSDPGYIDKAILHHLRTNAEYTKIVGLPEGVDREIITAQALEWLHDHAIDPQKTEYMTWFLDQPAFIYTSNISAKKEHRRPSYRLTLDTSKDLELLQWLYYQFDKQDKGKWTLDDIISLLDANPDKAVMNTVDQISKKIRLDVETGMNLQISTLKGK